MANNVDTTGLKVTIGWMVDHDHEGLLVLSRKKPFMTPKPFRIIGETPTGLVGFLPELPCPGRCCRRGREVAAAGGRLLGAEGDHGGEGGHPAGGGQRH